MPQRCRIKGFTIVKSVQLNPVQLRSGSSHTTKLPHQRKRAWCCQHRAKTRARLSATVPEARVRVRVLPFVINMSLQHAMQVTLTFANLTMKPHHIMRPDRHQACRSRRAQRVALHQRIMTLANF